MGKPRKKTRPKQRDKERGTKRAYQTMEEAERAAFRPRSMLRTVGFMTGYRCRICRLFHVGHPPGFR